MSEGRAKNQWQHTSVLLSMLANAHRDPKKSQPFTPDDFNPFKQKSRQPIVIDKSNVHLLKQYFVPTKKGKP